MTPATLPLSIHFPGKLVFGKGTLGNLPAEILQMGLQKVFILTIDPLLPNLQVLISALESRGMAVAVDTSILQKPTCALIKACGIPARLREVNVPADAIPGMTADALKITRLLKNNPREITLQDAINIYSVAY